MDNSLYYLTLNRQIGLSAELDLIANNIANLDTVGYRREGLAFTEFVLAAESGDSVSMADMGARFADENPGVQTSTGGSLDIAIEGSGYFVVEGQDGPVLTRAGVFQLSEIGNVVNSSGQALLDTGQAPITVPPGTSQILIGNDGTLSADGEPVAQIAVVDAPRETLSRVGDTAFTADEGFDQIVSPRVRQGAVEASNVDPVIEIARMIEVTRAYETAQTLIEDEDERLRDAVRTLGQAV